MPGFVDFAKGLVSTMGSLLVLWLVIELLESEIDRLKGGAFRLNLFVGWIVHIVFISFSFSVTDDRRSIV